MKIFIGKNKNTAVLNPYEVDSFEDFYKKFIKFPYQGEKGGYYFTTASNIEITLSSNGIPDHYHRNIKTHLSSWGVCIDGDSSIDNENSCIPPSIVHEVLKRHKINHIIYTTPSYNPPTIIKWRLVVPCKLSSENLKEQHKEAIESLYQLLEQNGCEKLKRNKESFILSQMWFLPVVKDLERNPYESFIFTGGEDFKTSTTTTCSTSTNTIDSSPQSDITTTEKEIVYNIVTATSPLHESINKYIYGSVVDGRTPEAIKATLHGLTTTWNLKDSKLSSYKKDIDRLVDTAYKKFKVSTTEHWDEKIIKNPNSRIFTDYPDQGGMMEELVQCCMDWMIFPNRQIAVVAARAVIATLGGRVYTLPSGKGVALTALITGRSTIGKSNIKKFFIWLMNNFQLANTASEFLGSHYYTSAKNLVDDLKTKHSLLTIRTESGLSDKSKAGDITRVMAYELEFSTESGYDGYISSGAQNDKIPALFSPSVTTVRESVAKIQSEADILNQSTIGGATGRRSLVLIDPEKGIRNVNPIKIIPNKIKKLLSKLYTKAAEPKRNDMSKPLDKELWVIFKFEDQNYLYGLENKWLEKENKAARLEDDYTSTFYGRLYERVPAYAGLLAIADNPDNPVITNKHIDIAENSLLAELNAHKLQEIGGELDDPISKIISKIEKIFTGNMKKNISYYRAGIKEIGKRELSNGAMEWQPISIKIQRYIKNLTDKDKNIFHQTLEKRLEEINIVLLTKKETQEMFGHKRKTFKRI